MNQPLISIIIPVFQVEKYLNKCISSVVAQTYKNLEIILVDDGSHDSSPVICDKRACKDSRIIVIHKDNKGLSDARNVGIKKSSGDYIGFVDSDDWIEYNMYEKMINAISEDNADIAVCNFIEEPFRLQKYSTSNDHSKRIIYSSEDALKMIITWDGYINTVVWNKLYKRNVVKNIFFPEGKICEDVLWTSKVIGNSRIITCINYPFYHYLYRSKSLFHDKKLSTKRFIDFIEICDERIEYIHNYYPKLEKLAILKFQNFCCSEFINLSLNHPKYINKNKQQRLYNTFCKYCPVFIFNVNAIKNNFLRLLFWLSPNLFFRIYMIYNKK